MYVLCVYICTHGCTRRYFDEFVFHEQCTSIHTYVGVKAHTHTHIKLI